MRTFLQLRMLKKITLVTLALLSTTTIMAAPLFAEISFSYEQKTISGVVYDTQSGETLPGVSVSIKGANTGTITDLDGSFQLQVEPGAVLVFSYVGYLTQEVPVQNQTSLTVNLETDIQSLEEVAIIGYGKVKRSNLTGSVSTVSAETLEQTNKVDAVSSIQGQVAGVTVQRTDNKPGGGGFNIRVRGANTINTGSGNGGYSPGQNPLFVVDGIFVDDISFLNPADIERMDVLKDAASAAIYGSRGTNGVVIIQTKKGKEGKMTVRYNNYVGFKEIYNLPPVFNGKSYIPFLRDVVVGNQFASNKDGNYGQYSAAAVNINDYLSDEELQNIANGVSTDWVDLITRNGFQQNHTLDISGGNENTVYAAGLGYTQDQGTVYGEDFNRYTLKGNIQSDLTDWLTFGYDNYITLAKTNEGSLEAFRSAYRLKPIGRAYDDNGDLLFLPTQKETQLSNPIFDTQNWKLENKYINFIGNISLSVKPLEGLSITTKFAPNIKYTRVGEYRGLYTKSAIGNQSNTRAEVNNFLDYSYTWDNIVDYSLDINNDNSLAATLVYSRFLQDNESYGIQVRNFTSDNFLFYNLGAGSNVNSYGSGFKRQTLESYTARINYNLMDRYILTLTGRYDGASVLSDDNKWAFFPSASFAYRVIREDFMRNQKVFSDLKLRLSYGQTGNNGIGGGLNPLGTLSLLESSYTNIGDASVSTLFVNGLANQDLTWERTSEVNVGFDFGFLNNRLTGSVDVYNRNIKDIIFFRPLPTATGFGGTFDNIGESRNRGIEVGLNAKIIDNEDFTWSTNLNFASNRNEIVNLYGNSDEIIFGAQGGTFIHRVGEPTGSLYGFKYDGIWQLDQAAEAESFGQKPGQVRVVDVNGDGQITEQGDRVVLGNPLPKWTGGFTSTMNYKNFDFSFFVYTSQGVTISSNFHNARAFSYDGEPARLWNGYDTNYWTPENPTNNWFQPGNGGPYQGAIKNMDVSFVKVGFMTLGYALPQETIQKLGIQKLRLYTTVQNPFTFSDYDGWDPENAGRNTYGASFMARTYMAGINFTF
ncbi:TonB-linked SusC/RagA family outer membrane protein [Leeuwenhoekiella aestuarii]|uniref:TonB-linked SusC/RagA family outer membrane protein n=1 Tax=Leeuwenhoekiella aestuarii TaxID=2249426 RepID=A0A4Q0NXS9_9FLAO|nr:TonB-dependent receptor [Leeuwenhoekiella aestuarii]RXG12425.1 TonB-linked SusC/RagA family outer membrane protein [Leeuwenhoekiella aestuarii]RXG16439.1 TonB-linked SusC/RagA family outer membrane protein [Leeuwenhoekiella aestuarii]